MRRAMLLAAALLAGCAGDDPAGKNPEDPAVTVKLVLPAKAVEGDVSTASLVLDNPTDTALVIGDWEIRMDGTLLAGEGVPARVRADELREDRAKGEITLTAHWVHDDMPPAAARLRSPSILDGKRDFGFRPVDLVVAPHSKQEWTTRFVVPLGARPVRFEGKVSLFPATPSLRADLFAPAPDNPSIDPEAAWRRWSARLPNAPPTREPEPADEPVTLRYLSGGEAAAGALLRESAFLTPVRVGEMAGIPVTGRDFPLDEASKRLGLRGQAAWAGAWIVSDGESTGFARPDDAFTLPGNLVDTFRGAWFAGLGTWYSQEAFPASVEKAFGPSGPVKGGGHEITVRAEKLYEFAKMMKAAGWVLTGNSAMPGK
ncbi:MAG: hypothetical protein HYY18_23100 [Planctomycetes bacterium]|nr:hypothetical protein [Planctomycetota bacterium]